MPRYIDAEVLKSRLEDFSRWCKDGRKEGVDFVLDCPLPDIPTADVQEVRHGRWVNESHLMYGPISAQCSVCELFSGTWLRNAPYKYCPHCGAKMDE